MIDTKQILVCAAVLVVAGTSLGIRAEEVCENPQQNVQVCTQFAGNSGNCKTSSLEPCDTSETDASAALYCPQVCNDRPVMTNPTVLLAEDTIITEASSVSLLEAVADANAGDTFELTNVGGTTTDGGGDIEFFSDGHYSYDPPLNFSGTDSVEITITDVQVPSVPLAVTGRLTFIISAVNDAPVAMNDVASTNQDTQLMSVASLVGNDTDVDSAGLTAVVETNKTTSRGGQIDIRSDGTFTYDPPTGFAGSDTVSYTVQDADAAFSSALLTIQVLAVTTGNNAPVAVSDLFALGEDAGVTKSSISLLANDADADGNVLTALTESAKA
ncbi:MAG: cadherin-like domain-containing protein, partial [Gammaproteobacteria bacterium]|nr:cadherin-like domain-containing protein [Gammaproteobacteria bacterium]